MSISLYPSNFLLKVVVLPSRLLIYLTLEVFCKKKLFLKISQISQENTCVGVSFFNNVAGPQACTFIKKRLQHRCFSAKFAKFFKNTYFEGHLQETASIKCNSHTQDKKLALELRKNECAGNPVKG